MNEETEQKIEKDNKTQKQPITWELMNYKLTKIMKKRSR